MVRTINEGDRVKVCWTPSGLLDGVVQNVPSETGDLWYILDDNGVIHAVNPSCSTFECIIKEPVQPTTTSSEGDG